MKLFTHEQLEFLRIGYAQMIPRDLAREFNAKFHDNKTEQQISCAVKNRRFPSGRTGRFEKGNLSWNVGTKGATRANITSFRKGNKPANRKPLGSERICSKDGFILVKIKERDPYTGFPTRYKHKHVHVWEKKHGKVPDGFVVAFKDGNKMNCKPGNLMLITRAELLRLNKHGYKNIPNDLKPSLLAMTKLEVKTFELLKVKNDLRS